MGRNKTLFTEEQDCMIKLLTEQGKSLNEVVNLVNKEFGTEFSRSGIDRRIKYFGLARPNKTVKIDKEVRKQQQDKIKYDMYADKIDLLKELKRQQSWYGQHDDKMISNQDIMRQLGIGVEKFNEMCEMYDIPERKIFYVNRPDLYYNVTAPDGKKVIEVDGELVVDCTSMQKRHLDHIYDFIMERKPQDMKVERDAIIEVDGSFVDYKTEKDERARTFINPIKIKVDLYFPDYNIAFYHSLEDDKITKPEYHSGLPNSYGSFMKNSKSKIKLVGYMAMHTVTDGMWSLSAAADNILKRLSVGDSYRWGRD